MMRIWTFLKHGRSRITNKIAHFLVNLPEAQYIAAYPRSGSTWLRTLIVNLLVPDSNSNPAVFNRVIPGVTLTRLNRVYAVPKPRILATHSNYRRNINRAVYLIRDGRDSFLSLYRYTTIRKGIEMDFNRWFHMYMQGYYGRRWDKNVESWLVDGAGQLKQNMLVIRYEDLCRQTKIELKKVCDFFDIDYTEKELSQAVDLSSLENMRVWEHKYAGKLENEDASFYRGCQKNEWEDIVSEELKIEFMRVSETALRLGGYIDYAG